MISTYKTNKIKYNNLLLFNFFFYNFSNDVKSQGFTFLIDMRSNSNTAATTKAVLKVLQEHVGPELVSQVIIIKSDNFWHKQRAAITSSHKYKFEVILS